eukprot:706988-Prymnesium_polylepis.1
MKQGCRAVRRAVRPPRPLARAVRRAKSIERRWREVLSGIRCHWSAHRPPPTLPSGICFAPAP